ncbi:hypothetical protein Tco_0991709 [Tanacetum coccineum]|uniref:Uncharacterized protein n=1 Tax=Tanacetum coccineum TaxID=301880 RepID=A0ABQ5F1B3_9ASTR
MERGIPIMSVGVQAKALACLRSVSMSLNLHSAVFIDRISNGHLGAVPAVPDISGGRLVDSAPVFVFLWGRLYLIVVMNDHLPKRLILERLLKGFVLFLIFFICLSVFLRWDGRQLYGAVRLPNFVRLPSAFFPALVGCSFRLRCLYSGEGDPSPSWLVLMLLPSSDILGGFLS